MHRHLWYVSFLSSEYCSHPSHFTGQQTWYFQATQPSEQLNTTLAPHGHIACAPMDPSLAFSFQALDLYRILGTRCPQLSVQAFVCGLCDHHHVSMVLLQLLPAHWDQSQVPYPPYLHSQATVTIDAYYETQCQVDACINQGLGHDLPEW